MATSKTGGAFGYLHKKLGGLVYSAPKLGISQQRVQVVRTKAESVSNPNTVGQIMQRMKLGAATRFFSAYESVVNKGIMSHSFESVKYGQPSRLYFMQKALKEESAVFVPKGIDFFVPGEYLVSEGSLQSLPWRTELDAAPATALLTVGAAITAADVTALAAYNIAEGDQITIMAAVERAGRYYPACARVVLQAGQGWNYTANEFTGVLNQIRIGEDGTFVGAALNGNTVAALAVIISRGFRESSDARSTEYMLFVNGYSSLKSPAALQAAIDSYLDDTTFNSLNSDWYLNQGNGQSYDGRVLLSDFVGVTDGTNTLSGEFMIGQKQSDSVAGQLVYTVFTVDGTAAGQAIIHNGNNIVAPATFDDDATVITGKMVADALADLGYGSPLSFATGTAEIAAQGGFTLGA